MNVDAAVGRGLGAAAVSRDRDGNFLGASAIVFKGILDPTTLEALAVRESMALTGDLNLQDIHVASHYKVIIDDMKLRG